MLAAIALAVLCCAPLAASAQPVAFNLTILHTNDLRGRLLPVDRFGGDCSLQDLADSPESCFGGAARRSTVVDWVRGNASNVVLVDAGDVYFGSLFFQVFHGEATAEVLNAQRYDALCLGQSEFYQDVLTLRTFLSHIDARIPVLAANVDFSEEPALNSTRRTKGTSGMTRPWMQPWSVSVRNGTKIGFVGMVREETPTLSTPGPYLKFNVYGSGNDAIPSVQIAVLELQKEHPDCKIIILLSSGKLASSLIAARSVVGVDVVVAGDRLAMSVGSEDNPYPLVVQNAVGDDVLVVAAGYFGQIMGRINVGFDADGKVRAWTPQPVSLTSAVPRQPAMASELAEWHTSVLSLSAEVVGVSAHDVFGERLDASVRPNCWSDDCPMGRLIAASYLSVCEECQIALTNAGGIRGSFRAGNVTWGDVLRASPFQNTIATFRLRGTFIVEALSYMTSLVVQAAQDDSQAGAFLHFAGLRYAWDSRPGTPESRRVLLVEVQSRSTGEWQPLSVNRVYHVVSNSYLRSGGDGFDMLRDEALDAFDFGAPVQRVLANYVGATAPMADLVTMQQLDSTPCLGLDAQRVAPGSWPLAGERCRILETSGAVSFLSLCPSNTSWCEQLTSGKRSAARNLPPGITANASLCFSCSGLGSCEKQVCRCHLPAADSPLAGKAVVRGASCADVASELPTRGPLTGLAVVLVLLAACAVLASHAFLAVYRRKPIVQHSSPLFSHLIAGGGGLIAVAAAALLLPPSNGTCAASIWLGILGYACMFGSLFAKTYRVHRLFNNRRLRKVSVRDVDLLRGLALVLVVELLLLTALQTGGGFIADAIVPNRADIVWYTRCGVADGAVNMIPLLAAVNLLPLLVGLYLAWQVRNVSAGFNESKFIALSLFNFTAAAAIAVPTFALADTFPAIAMSVIPSLFAWVVLFTLAALLGPKAYGVMRNIKIKGPSTSDSSKASTGGGGSSGDHGSSARTRKLMALVSNTRSAIKRTKGLPPEQRVRELDAMRKDLQLQRQYINTAIATLDKVLRAEAQRSDDAKAVELADRKRPARLHSGSGGSSRTASGGSRGSDEGVDDVEVGSVALEVE
eukprot:PLAT4443.5.p1 GENE.PLAT4443.5~~PLAT4443.5.p1  ORF type:complete len:1083 (-),score=544.47 PLAT4443.5:164-3412(-)